MQVILIKDVENLGYANDIVEVRPGYANNYLIPQGYAKSATASARKVLAEKFGDAAANTVILYGGSCKPSNAAELFAKEDVDGGLIGGAALVASDFIGIGKGFSK